MLVWITECLKTGETWESGFCHALCSSSLVVPVISRETFPSHDVHEIDEDSPCDNVILELDLALALVWLVLRGAHSILVTFVLHLHAPDTPMGLRLPLHAVTFQITCTHSSDFSVLFDPWLSYNVCCNARSRLD
jgi:hypothetical protein